MNTKKAKSETIVLAILNTVYAFSIITHEIPAMQTWIRKFVWNNPHLLPQLYPVIFMVHSARLFNVPIDLQ